MTCAARCSIALIAVARRRQAEESRHVPGACPVGEAALVDMSRRDGKLGG